MLTCIFEDGGTGQMRHAVVDTIVHRRHKILLNKRASRLLEGGKWGLLGGYIDLNESIREAVKREVFEESGWRVDNLQLLTGLTHP